MPLIKPVMGTGLAGMAVVAVAAAVWPAVAGLVSGLLVAVLGTGAGTLAVLGTRWVRGELAWRRELRAMPPVDAVSYEATPVTPSLAELRESA